MVRFTVIVVVVAGLVGGCGQTSAPQGSQSSVNQTTPGGLPLPVIEFGLTHEVDSSFRVLNDNDGLPLYTGEQWGHHIIMTLRGSNFPPAEFFRVPVMVDEAVIDEETGEVVSESRTRSEFLELDSNLVEMANRVIFLDVPVGSLDNKVVTINMTISSIDDERISVTVSRRFVLEPKFGSVNPIVR